MGSLKKCISLGKARVSKQDEGPTTNQGAAATVCCGKSGTGTEIGVSAEILFCAYGNLECRFTRAVIV